MITWKDIAVTIAIFASIGLPAATGEAAIELLPVATGLDSPVFVTNAGDGSNRLFIVEQAGVIKVLPPGESTPTVFLDIRSRVLFGGERGLLGLAFHPDFASNGRFFVDYVRASDGSTVIAEYQVSPGNPDVADAEENVLLVIAQPFPNHKGGMVEFGPDGFLYIGMGDGGSENDPGNRAQNTAQFLGKILRIDPDNPGGGKPYGIPPGNPFASGAGGLAEIYAFGFRNPFRFSFDRGTGALYAADVGQDVVEEIDIVTAGGNYGWRIWEGTRCTNNDPGKCTTAAFTFPIAEYRHNSGRCAVIGGYVYRGSEAAVATGAYVFGDLCTGEIFLLNGGVMSVALDSGLSLSSFGEDEAGELYAVDLGGSVRRITGQSTCTFSLTRSNQSFAAGGGKGGRVKVKTGAGCAWTVSPSDSWITVTSGASGLGKGTVTFSLASNKGSAASRTGTITIGGQTITITQRGRQNTPKH